MSQAESHMTIDHDEIRRWAEQRKGKPSTVKRTEGKRGEAGILRIDFPGFSGKGSLEEISWDEFFEKFEQSKLALLYQQKTADGKKSNFNKLVKRPANMKAARQTSKSSGRKSSQIVSKSSARGSAKAGLGAPKAKSGTRTKPKSTTKAKASTKSATREKAASTKSPTRSTSRTTSKPKAKTKLRSRAKTSARLRKSVKSRRLAKS